MEIIVDSFLIKILSQIKGSKRAIFYLTSLTTITFLVFAVLSKPTHITKGFIEIGYYELPHGEVINAEEISEIIKDIKIKLILKSNIDEIQDIFKIFNIENRIVKFQIVSSSLDTNKEIFTELKNYIEKKHLSSLNLYFDKKLTELRIYEDELKLMSESEELNASDFLKISYLENNVVNASGENLQTYLISNLDLLQKQIKQSEKNYKNSLNYEVIKNLSETTSYKDKRVFSVIGFFVGLILSLFYVLIRDYILAVRKELI